MNTPRSRPGHRTVDTGRPAAPVDLGLEPALAPSGAKETEERQPVSWRWLGGTVLTGLGGGSLVAAALMLSIDKAAIVVEAPRFDRAAPKSTVDGAPVTAPKADRLVRPTEVIGAKQSYRAPMTLRLGDREIIKDRNFVRVATGVSTASGPRAAEVPPFSPLKLMTEGTKAEQFAEPALESSEADVSLRKRDLAVVVFAGDERGLADEEAAAQIGAERRASGVGGRRMPLPLAAPPMLLTRSLRAPLQATSALGFAPLPEEQPFSSIEVRVVPENVTQLAKVDPAEQASQPVERTYLAKRGDTVERVLRGFGVGSGDVREILALLAAKRRDGAIEEGRTVKVLAGPGAGGAAQALLRVAIASEGNPEFVAARTDKGVLVAVDEQTSVQAVRRRAPIVEDDGTGLRLYQGFYETALNQGLPKPIIDEMVRLFSNDFDFQRRASSDDSFEVFYAEEEAGEFDLMFAAMTVGGEKRRYYRFIDPKDGSVDYYDETGKSAQKFLIRKPIAGGELRSGFGSRYHPILRYYKMHNGVDWADKHGTPIVAAGTGRIVMAGWDSGYGRRVEIEHGNGYVTSYSHMAGFARGIQDGARVRQGQVIGFMGATGLATGPHLHYEVIVNGTHQDPMRLKVPRGRQFDGAMAAAFTRHRNQVDDLIARAPGNMRLAAGLNR